MLKEDAMFKKLHNMYRYLRFCLILLRLGVFSRRNPFGVLLILKEYLLSEGKVYNEDLKVLYRTPEQTAQLIANLVDSYGETKSETSLKQMFELIRLLVMKGDK